jgi:ferredoxin-NADP reductase
MARAAVLGRLRWQVATVTDVRDEGPIARTLGLAVPEWPGHDAGQHLDLRLTAPDGYSAQRSYSIANAPDDHRVELTVERLSDGEVSPYLADVVQPGDMLEVRGPIGGWFVWTEDVGEPVMLLGGGSGIVPLMAMVRARSKASSRQPFRLLYSVRTPDLVFFRDELAALAAADDGFDVTFRYTRSAPPDWSAPVTRIDRDLLKTWGMPPAAQPLAYVCGPTGFVEAAANLLVGLGHPAERIRTERFGPTGGGP